MKNDVIIADASCLIVLDNIGRLDLLELLYDKILITTTVKREFEKEIPNWIEVEDPNDKIKQKILELDLDEGESSSIALCLEKEKSILIIDERKGRNIAKKLGLRITGTLAVLMKSKAEGHINSISQILLDLEKENFRISKTLKYEILKIMNE